MIRRWFGREEVSPLTELLLITDAADDPLINVVFVHGLDGNPIKTWAFDLDESWHTWLSAKLPNACIWSLHYTLRSTRWSGESMPIADRAINVLATLQSELLNGLPIVFVCHSYGGLLIKQAVLTARDSATEYAAIAERTLGVVFLATPHTGSGIAQYIDAFPIFRSTPAITELRQNAAALRELNRRFKVVFDKSSIEVSSYFETRTTHGIRIVDEQSGDIGFGRTAVPIDCNHIEICKPPRADFRVTQTISLIRGVTPAPKPVAKVERSLVQQLMVAKGDHFHGLKRKIEKLAKTDGANPNVTAAIDFLETIEENRLREVKLEKYRRIGNRRLQGSDEERQQEQQEQRLQYFELPASIMNRLYGDSVGAGCGGIIIMIIIIATFLTLSIYSTK